MKLRMNVLAIAAATALGSASFGSVVLTNTISNGSGSRGYSNASSIPVSATDLINGLSPIASNYNGCCETGGGTTVPFTDGSTGIGNSAVTSATNALFDIGGDANHPQPWYTVYDLGAAKAIGSVVVTTGHQDSRVNQVYDILVSNDNTNFTSLSDGTSHVVGDSGAGFNYSPSIFHADTDPDPTVSNAYNEGGAAQSTVADNASPTLATARYVEFVALDNGNDVFRELDVIAATPEPASLSLLGFAAFPMLARRRRA